MRRPTSVCCSMMMLLAPSAEQVRAQVCAGTEDLKISATDGAAGAGFGRSVAISGNTAIVGADGAGDPDAGVAAGAAYIFDFNGASWEQRQKLVASDRAALDAFGVSVGISGDTAIVGAYGDDDLGDAAGAAYIFRFNGTAWEEEQKLLASDGLPGAAMGGAVAIDGNTAIVGAVGIGPGAAYVFRFDGTSWLQEQKLLASDGEANDWFGVSVAISGDTAIVGAWFDDDPGLFFGQDAGSAYVFRFDGTSWIQQQKIRARDRAADDTFGASVAISDNVAIVGADGKNDPTRGIAAGSAYIFSVAGSGWVERQKILASDGAAGDFFGSAVAIDGDTAVVASAFDDDPVLGDNTGSVYVFQFNGSRWVQQEKLLASDLAANDWFGASVAVSGSRVVVGAWLDDDPALGNSVGSAYIFEEPWGCGPCPCEWTEDDPANVDALDLLAYLHLWFAADAAAEMTGDEPVHVDVFDLLAMLECWFPASVGAPCP